MKMRANFTGPMQALLWEQWRLVRAVFLLPLVAPAALLVNIGLRLFTERDPGWHRIYEQVAELLLSGGCFLALLFLLSQPDQRLNLRLTLTERYRRLPVPSWQLLASTLLVRSLAGAVAIWVTVALHNFIFNGYSELDPIAIPVIFLCYLWLLYGFVAPLGHWGERLSGLSLALLTVPLGTFLIYLYAVISDFPAAALPAALVSFSVALAGGMMQHRLQRQRAHLWFTSLPTLRRKAQYAYAADIPRFRSSLAAQSWYEWRRYGNKVPIAATIMALGGLGFVSWQQRNNSSFDITDVFALAFSTFLFLGPCAGLLIATQDHLLYRRPEGRFLLVRPVHPTHFAAARRRAGAWAMLLSVLCLMVMLLLYSAAHFTLYREMDFVRFSYRFTSPDTASFYYFYLFLYGLCFPLFAWGIMFVLNRYVVACMVLAHIPFYLGVYIFNSAVEFHLMLLMVFTSIATISYLVARGLLRPWPVLPLLALAPLTSILVLLDTQAGEYVMICLLLLGGCIATSALPYHLRRSSTWLPQQLDTHISYKRQWAWGLAAAALVALVLFPVHRVYHAQMTRSAEEAFARAEAFLAALPDDPSTPNYFLLREASAFGEELEAINNQAMKMEAEAPAADEQDAYERFSKVYINLLGETLPSHLERIETAYAAHGDQDLENGTVQDLADIPAVHITAFFRGIRIAAIHAAEQRDAALTERCLMAGIRLTESTNAIPLPMEAWKAYQGSGVSLSSGIQLIAKTAVLDPPARERLRDAIPEHVHPGVVKKWLTGDVSIARSFKNKWHKGNALWEFWYLFSGVEAWDQRSALELLESYGKPGWTLDSRFVTSPPRYLPRAEQMFHYEQGPVAIAQWDAAFMYARDVLK